MAVKELKLVGKVQARFFYGLQNVEVTKEVSDTFILSLIVDDPASKINEKEHL